MAVPEILQPCLGRVRPESRGPFPGAGLLSLQKEILQVLRAHEPRVRSRPYGPCLPLGGGGGGWGCAGNGEAGSLREAGTVGKVECTDR